MKRRMLIVNTAIALVFIAPCTHAEGVIAGALRDMGVISEEQRSALDGAHAAIGNPLDHAANAAATYYAPGSVQAYQQLQQASGAFQPPPIVPPIVRNPSVSQPYPVAAPSYGPAPYQAYQTHAPTVCVTQAGACYISYNFTNGRIGDICNCSGIIGVAR